MAAQMILLSCFKFEAARTQRIHIMEIVPKFMFTQMANTKSQSDYQFDTNRMMMIENGYSKLVS